jgi:hypothetical protein
VSAYTQLLKLTRVSHSFLTSFDPVDETPRNSQGEEFALGRKLQW